MRIELSAARVCACRTGPVRHDAARRGAVWSLAVALAWFALALWRPTTTWHLAPVVTSGVLPWFVMSDLGSVRRKARAVLLAAGAGGIAAVLATLALSGLGLLRGPTVQHSHGATSEALLLAGGTALAAALAGLLVIIRSGGSDATSP